MLPSHALTKRFIGGSCRLLWRRHFVRFCEPLRNGLMTLARDDKSNDDQQRATQAYDPRPTKANTVIAYRSFLTSIRMRLHSRVFYCNDTAQHEFVWSCIK